MVMTRTGPSFQEVALRVGSCNLKADLDLEKFDPTLHIIIEFLKSHPIHKPLTKSIEFPLSIIHTAYSSAIYDSDEEYIEFDISKDNTIKLWKAEFLEAIGLPERKEKKTFYEPTNEELFDVLDQMGYLPPRLEWARNFLKGKLPGIWHFLVHIIVRCLTGKVGGTSTLSRAFLVLLFGIYTGKEVDFGTIIWNDFAGCVFPRKKEIPCARFWALALQKLHTKLNVSLPEGEEMFTTGTVSGYAIPDQAEFGKVARLPEAMLQYIEKNSEVLIRHIEETDPPETGHPIQFAQPVRPTEGHTSSPARKKQIALNVKKTTGLGTKRKCENIISPQAKRPTIGSQSSTSNISLSSEEEDDVSQKNGDIAHTPPPSSQKQTPGIHSHINLEATETSSSFHTIQLEKNLWGSPGHNTKDQGPQGRVFEPMLKSSSNPGQESSSMAHQPLQTGFFGISIGEAEVRASESESVRQARDEQERQKREQSEREEILSAEQERFSQIYYYNIYPYEQMLREQRIRDEMEKEESKKVKAAKHAEYRKKRKEILMQNKRKEDELKAKMQREQEEREKTEALREAEAKKQEERKKLVRILRDEQLKREEEEWARTSVKLLKHAMSLDPSTKTGMESAQDMEKDFVFAADDGLIQDSDSHSIMETLKPSKSTLFLATSETESQELPNTLPTTTVGTSTPRRRTKWKKKKKKKSKYISRVEFNSLNQKLSQVLEVVNKIPPSKDKFVSKEEFGEMQKIVTSLAQRVPNLETREKTLRESVVKSTADALKKMEQKRTNDTFKYLDRMDEMLKMVKEIQQSYDHLTNTVGHQHGDEIVRLSEQLCDYRNKNIILQAVLVKVIQSVQQLLRPCNLRFDEIVFAIQKVQNSVDVLPKTLSNDELSKQVPQSFQKVFDLIDDLKGSRFVDEAGEDDNVVITETYPSPKIDVVSKPQPPPPPPNTTIPPTECEIHESPKIPSSPTSFVMPRVQITPEFPETPKAPINDKGKMPLEISQMSPMKTFPVCEKEMKEHTITLWVDDIRQLKDDELVPKQTTAPPSSDEYQWDIPMSPNARYYSVFPPLHPHLSREMQIPIELNRLEEFFKAHAQPPKDVWSLRRIIRVVGYKKRSFQKEDYFSFDVVRSDNKKYFFSEADFPNLNPNDLYVIAKHFQTKLLTHQPSRFPFLQIQRFLRSLTYDLGSIDAERFDSFVDNPPEYLEGIENRHRGPTEDPELGIIFSNEKDSPRLFFRLKQKHRCKTEFLEKMINLTLRSNASAALKVKIIEELEWWVAVHIRILSAEIGRHSTSHHEWEVYRIKDFD
ncbi:unnamed protein product [Lactuca saligna]|uniref:Uncharacterized protein n=1 Tax=Lactuca saligna TaxID=75948 RepID=A0AA35ZQD6_LACSI|nr:unnamed protein product [Lactuca saligna]